LSIQKTININPMKTLFKVVIPIFLLAFVRLYAQNIIVNNDTISINQFVKEYETGLKTQGIQRTINSHISFRLIQDFSKSMRVDTTTNFKNQLISRLNELKKEGYFPKNLKEKYLEDYILTNQKERQIQIFLADKSKKKDYGKVYDDVRQGKISMQHAVENETGKNIEIKPIFIKAGTLEYELEKNITKLRVGEYTELIETPKNIMFIKLLSERPSLGYIIFGTLSYANADNSEILREEIYKQLSSGKSFQEVASMFGTGDNEKNNGGLVLGSPTLPDEVYHQIKDLKEGQYTKIPVLVNDNWVIFNVYSKIKYELTPENTDFFFNDMIESEYGTAFYAEFIESLKKSTKYKEYIVFDRIKKSYTEFKKLSNFSELICSYGKEHINVGEFKNQVEKLIENINDITNDEWKNLVEIVANNFLINAYTKDFENSFEVKKSLKDTEKNLYSNYFYVEYLKKIISDNPQWLTEYYNSHKDKFRTDALARGRIIILSNESDVKKIAKTMKNIKNWEKLKTEYKEKKNDNGETLVTINEGEMPESAEIFTKYGIPFKKGVFTAKIGGKTLIMANDEIIPSEILSEEEARKEGLLENLVETDMIEKIISDLKEKAKIIIDTEFVPILNKEYEL